MSKSTITTMKNTFLQLPLLHFIKGMGVIACRIMSIRLFKVFTWRGGMYQITYTQELLWGTFILLLFFLILLLKFFCYFTLSTTFQRELLYYLVFSTFNNDQLIKYDDLLMILQPWSAAISTLLTCTFYTFYLILRFLMEDFYL